MREHLRFVDACREEHFAAMSRIHALGWHDTYVGYVPDSYLAQEITDERWIPFFREDYKTGRCHGLLLCRDETPVACLNYGPARAVTQQSGDQEPSARAYEGWGELLSFYTHPEERGKGYGGLLIEEALRRLREMGVPSCYVLVLRENEGARRFYASHGFAWDGGSQEIPFPEDTICVDLRYVHPL